MSYVTGWAVAIVGTVILSSFAELILPDGDMKKYANLTLGLIIMVILVRPVMQLKNVDLLKHEFDFGVQMIEDMEEVQSEQVRDMFEERIAADMERTLKVDFYEMYISVEADEKMNILRVTVLGSKPKDAQSIIAVLKRQYGDVGQIIIE